MTGRDWRHRASCRDHDPETWFPIGTTGPALVQTEQAKAACARCPAVDECRTWAIDNGQEHGIWGGLTEDERRTVGAPSTVVAPVLADTRPVCVRCGLSRPRHGRGLCRVCYRVECRAKRLDRYPRSNDFRAVRS